VVDKTTVTNAEPQVWCSGDWKTIPRKTVPYNGVEIVGTPVYDDNGKFVSADLKIVDCTYVPDGVASELHGLNVGDGWQEIPAAVVPTSPPSPDANFTVNGKLQLYHGSGSMLLGVDFSYGLTGQRHEELGFIFGFPTTIAVGAAASGGKPTKGR